MLDWTAKGLRSLFEKLGWATGGIRGYAGKLSDALSRDSRIGIFVFSGLSHAGSSDHFLGDYLGNPSFFLGGVHGGGGGGRPLNHRG